MHKEGAKLLARTLALREARALLLRIERDRQFRRSEFECVLKMIDESLATESASPDK